jgi:ATP-dependent Clp protease ATP-binding subunit ClpA
LIGLATMPGSLCGHVLCGMGVDFDELRRQLEQQPRDLDDGTASQKLPQTREFKLAIEAAIAVSREAGDMHVGTEHMLLGLLRYPTFASSRVLAERGVAFDRAKEAIALFWAAQAKGKE